VFLFIGFGRPNVSALFAIIMRVPVVFPGTGVWTHNAMNLAAQEAPPDGNTIRLVKAGNYSTAPPDGIQTHKLITMAGSISVKWCMPLVNILETCAPLSVAERIWVKSKATKSKASTGSGSGSGYVTIKGRYPLLKMTMAVVCKLWNMCIVGNVGNVCSAC
jgi:hypothetical protein